MPDAAADRAQVVEVHQVLDAAGMGDMVWGHAAIRSQDGNGVATKSSGLGFDEVTEQSVVSVSWDGEMVGGTGKPHIEVPIHTQIMAARPDVNCVVHTHSPTITAFAALDQPLIPVTYDSALFVDNLPRTDVEGLIRSRESGDELANSLGSAGVVLLPHHGVVTVGADAAEAVMHAVLLERACRAHLTVASAGGPGCAPSSEIMVLMQRAWQHKQLLSGYRYLLRHVADPDIRTASADETSTKGPS